MKEHDIQTAIVQWAALHTRSEWRLSLLYAIPNGGKRNPVTARRLKDEGVKAGVPDLCLACHGTFGHALYLEVKTKHSYPKAAQREWIEKLQRAGNGVVIVRSLDEAVNAIATHLNREDLKFSEELKEEYEKLRLV